MKPLLSDLQDLSELYQELEAEFSGLARTPASDGSMALVEAMLQKTDLLSRISGMEDRIAQHSHEWEQYRHRLDDDLRCKIQSETEKVRTQAKRLAILCEERIGMLSTALQKIESELGEIYKGRCYLESLKPRKTNHPKFIDSLT